MKRLWLLCVLAASACSGKNTATFLVAQGTTATLTALQGECEVDGLGSGVVDFDKGTKQYRAVAQGTARIPCDKGPVMIDVRPVDRVEIEGPGRARVGDKLSFVLRAFDREGNPLLFGDDDPVVWEFGGALRARSDSGCGDLLVSCTSRNTGYALAIGAGDGEVRAVFHGRAGRHAVSVGTVRRQD